jgi:hypothetical protein
MAARERAKNMLNHYVQLALKRARDDQSGENHAE